MNIPGHTSSQKPDPKTLNLSAVEEVLIQPVNEREERELYAAFYDHIYPGIHSSSLDYFRLEELTGLTRRRIRESLIYRLGAGEVPQLFGHETGTCYICRQLMSQLKNSEPVCLKCLQKIDKALTAMEDAYEAEKLRQEMLAKEQEGTLRIGQKTYTAPDVLDDTEYQEVLAELEAYKTLDELLAEQEAQVPEKTPEELEEIETILGILNPSFEEDSLSEASSDSSRDTDGAELDKSDLEIELMIDELVNSKTLRHFGFKRMKLTGTPVNASG